MQLECATVCGGPDAADHRIARRASMVLPAMLGLLSDNTGVAFKDPNV